jgi:hypothetical protein
MNLAERVLRLDEYDFKQPWEAKPANAPTTVGQNLRHPYHATAKPSRHRRPAGVYGPRAVPGLAAAS